MCQGLACKLEGEERLLDYCGHYDDHAAISHSVTSRNMDGFRDCVDASSKTLLRMIQPSTDPWIAWWKNSDPGAHFNYVIRH